MTTQILTQPQRQDNNTPLPILLRRAPRVPLSVITGAGLKAEYGNNIILWLTTADELQGMELRGDRRVLLALLKRLQDILQLSPESPAAKLSQNAKQVIDTWDWLTPAMVIEKFQSSPNLRPMLNDVKAVLHPAPFPTETNITADVKQVKAQLSSDDLFKDGKPIHGAQSKIARALGVQNAGGYRKRIQAVLQAMAA